MSKPYPILDLTGPFRPKSKRRRTTAQRLHRLVYLIVQLEVGVLVYTSVHLLFPG